MSEEYREETLEAERPARPRRRLRGLWRLPVLYALPFVALFVFAALRWGSDFRDLIQAIIKLVVRG